MYDFKDKEEIDDFDLGEVLINEILEDISNAPGALPLLSFTMHSFFELSKEKERNKRLILDDYKALNGVEGIISRKADLVYGVSESKLLREMSDKERLFRKILIRMVNLIDGAFVRRRVYLTLDEEGEAGTNVEQAIINELNFPEQKVLLKEIIDELEAANLVVRGTDESQFAYVEPAHDALINYWDRCRQWLDDFGQETLSLQRRLWQAVLDLKKDQLNQGDDAGVITEDLAMDIDHSWALNPKLDEITKAILDPKEKWIHFFPGDTFLEEIAPLVWGETLLPEQISRLEALKNNPDS